MDNYGKKNNGSFLLVGIIGAIIGSVLTVGAFLCR